jgi:ribosomal protein S12 methylthiotransferase
MKRRVSRKQTEVLLNKLRARVPGIAIRTTFIAGSPGETQQQHDELVQFVRDFGFDMLGVFPYSQEPGTPMGRMLEQVDEHVKKQRVEELMLAQQDVAFERAKSMVGQTIQVLIDRRAGRDAQDGWVARSQSQAPEIDSVVFVQDPRRHEGEFVDVSITDYQAYDLVAKVSRTAGKRLNVLSTR